MKSKFFFKILSIKLASCFFAVYIFARFTQLGDADRYVMAELYISSLNELFVRTYLVDTFSAVLSLMFGKGEQLNFVAAAMVAIVICHIHKDYYRHMAKIFWLLLIFPLFAVWTSIMGKEAMAFCAFLLLNKWIVEILVYGKSKVAVLFGGVVLGMIIRPHYFLAYALMIVGAYFFKTDAVVKTIKKPSVNKIIFSLGTHGFFIFLIGFLLIALAAITVSWWDFYLVEVMQIAQKYFSVTDANSTRIWVDWAGIDGFFSNMWWGIPASLIGPTLSEVVEKMIFLPFFLEGVLFLFLVFYFVFAMIKNMHHDRRLRCFVVYVFVPAVLLAVLVHYPFGIFNPGSAGRYKQPLTALFYFLPILLMAAVDKKRKERREERVSFPCGNSFEQARSS